MDTPADVHIVLSNAITEMNAAYSGIDLTYGGLQNYIPTCAGGGAQGGNFSMEVGIRQGLVIYNDPCNQIADLDGCSGTLAVGGLYGSGNHTFDGMTWISGLKSYVVVNNGVGDCLGLGNYTLMIVHELTHGLGLGHIAGSGTANMNPLCCIEITSLDEDCLDYTYPAALPVELLSFNAEKNPRTVNLAWSTASEINNDFFLVERSVAGRDFETIGKLPGAGNSQGLLRYEFVDHQPGMGTNYYRLRQVDFDGQFEYSDIRAVQFEVVENQISVYPNPVNTGLLNIDFAALYPMDIVVELVDMRGRTLRRKDTYLEEGVNQMQFSIGDQVPGMYLLRLKYGGNMYAERITVM